MLTLRIPSVPLPADTLVQRTLDNFTVCPRLDQCLLILLITDVTLQLLELCCAEVLNLGMKLWSDSFLWIGSCTKLDISTQAAYASNAKRVLAFRYLHEFRRGDHLCFFSSLALDVPERTGGSPLWRYQHFIKHGRNNHSCFLVHAVEFPDTLHLWISSNRIHCI